MILVDTAPLVAAANAKDDHHQRCVDLLAKATRPRLVPAPVIAEVPLAQGRRHEPADSRRHQPPDALSRRCATFATPDRLTRSPIYEPSCTLDIYPFDHLGRDH